MSTSIHTDLSGEGDIPAEVNGLIFFRRVFIQDAGSAHPIEQGIIDRWLGLGWTALYENITDGSGNGPVGQSLIDRQWCEFLYQGFDSKALVDSMQGASGIHYKFSPGVIATITFYEE